MIINEDYKMRDDLADAHLTLPVELLTGVYKGVILRFTVVNIVEGNDEATLKFQYELLEMGNHTETSLRKDKVFNQYAGLVLNSMIVEAFDATDKEENESGKNNSKELTKE
jgi:hypothetical protein